MMFYNSEKFDAITGYIIIAEEQLNDLADLSLVTACLSMGTLETLFSTSAAVNFVKIF